jgi:hypothetical protein
MVRRYFHQVRPQPEIPDMPDGESFLTCSLYPSVTVADGYSYLAHLCLDLGGLVPKTEGEAFCTP